METTSRTSPIIPPPIGLVGQIPVRNIWLLMLYASDLFRQLEHSKIEVEKSQDSIPDLVAEILASATERRLRRNLSYGYIEKDDVLNRVRGRINFFATERHQLMARGKISCHFDELTVNTPRNRYVRAALDSIAQIVSRKDLSSRCHRLAASMTRIGVVGARPTQWELSVDRLGRHDQADLHVLEAARLALEMSLPTELSGSRHLSSPDREENWMRKLYEKGIAGFYRVVLSKREWRVKSARKIGWLISEMTSGIDQILPRMKTDIELENIPEGYRVVIDTKFNSILTKGWYRDQTLRSGYIYQIYTYLRSQEDHTDMLAKNAMGLLLHPSVGRSVDEAVEIQGHFIRFSTVDLSAEASQIREQLLHLANSSNKYCQPLNRIS